MENDDGQHARAVRRMAAALSAAPVGDPVTAKAASAAREQAVVEQTQTAARAQRGRTVKFDSDTTDFRTKRPERGISRSWGVLSKAERANFGNTLEGVEFAGEIHELRLQARSYRNRPFESDGEDLSVLKIELLREAARVQSVFLSVLPPSIARAARTAIDEVRAVANIIVPTATPQQQKPADYTPVPAELNISRFGPTVSGGLPTMGRPR